MTCLQKENENYYPFGMVEPGRSFTLQSFDYGFNNKLNDNDVEGLGNSYDFNSREFNSRLSRFVSIDPDNKKYPSTGPYTFTLDNPIVLVDPKGKDVVYFNSNGEEAGRIKSDSRFETFVRVADNTLGSVRSELSPLAGSFVQVGMPKIISGFDKPQYQVHDYEIAAQTFLFNEKLYGNRQQLPTFPLHELSNDALMPKSLDPTLTKAIVVEESQAGNFSGGMQTGTTDIMQVNNSEDWSPDKASVGLSKGEIMTPISSLKAGIQWLYLKGTVSDADAKMSWGSENGSWDNAVKRYNGGGNPNYQQEVLKMYNGATVPKASNYSDQSDCDDTCK
jgi:RHS repeat-associated protein